MMQTDKRAGLSKLAWIAHALISERDRRFLRRRRERVRVVRGGRELKQPYKDILRIAGVDPLWYDEVGVPRYEPFQPKLANDIYADECALVLLACQYCGREMQCCVSYNRMRRFLVSGKPPEEFDPEYCYLADLFTHGVVGYGDPPCCSVDGELCTGATMSPMELRVLEYWRRIGGEWMRMPENEYELVDRMTPAGGE